MDKGTVDRGDWNESALGYKNEALQVLRSTAPVFEQQRLAMIDGQLRTNQVTDPLVLDAFWTVPREIFAPDLKKGSAYVDEDIDVGHGRVLMEPLVAARMLQFAEISPGTQALVVGAGNGYLPQLLIDLGAKVTAQEPVAALFAQGQELAPEARWVSHGFDTIPQGAFDLILFGGALSKVPERYGDALGAQGKIIAPISGQSGNDGYLIEGRATPSTLSWRHLRNAAVPALPEFVQAPGFEF